MDIPAILHKRKIKQVCCNCGCYYYYYYFFANLLFNKNDFYLLIFIFILDNKDVTNLFNESAVVQKNNVVIGNDNPFKVC